MYFGRRAHPATAAKRRVSNPTQEHEKNRNCSAVPQMLGRGLRSVLVHMSQADDNADAVLLDSYASEAMAARKACSTAAYSRALLFSRVASISPKSVFRKQPPTAMFGSSTS